MVVVGSATNGSDVRVKWMGYNTVDAVSAASVRPPPPLPAGWLESTDEESGFPYYENATTGETTWARPAPPRRPALPKRAVVPRLRAAAAVVGGVRARPPRLTAAPRRQRREWARVPWSPRRSPWRPSEASLPKRIAGPLRVPRRIRPWQSWADLRRRRTARRSGRSRALTSNMTPEQIAAMVDAARSNGFAGGCGGCDCGVAGC